MKQQSISDEIWSTSAGEMDCSGVQSHARSTSNPSEFVNPGLLLWLQTRQQWLANKRSPNRKQLREPTICWNAVYESLLGSNEPFPEAIPLPEMVNFLVDIWEQLGLYE